MDASAPTCDDPSGNRTRAETTVDGQAYVVDGQYDSLDRLTQEAVTLNGSPFVTKTFSYDAAGNRLAQVQGATQRAYQWDGAGNVKSKNAPGGLTTYTFDGANRMTRVQAPLVDVTFGYDANGQRVKEREGTREVWWVFDGLSPLMELNAAHVPTTLLVPGISKTRLDLPEPFTEYFLHDGLGSVLQLTDSRGNLTQEYQYEPFGSLQDAERGMRDPFNRYRFVGLAHDDRLGLTYMNARWYDPGVMFG